MLLRPEGLFPSRRRRRELHAERPGRRRRSDGRPIATQCSSSTARAADPPPTRRSILHRAGRSQRHSAASSRSGRSISRSRAARSSASSGPTAPARRRSSTSSPGSSIRPRAPCDPRTGVIARPIRAWLEPVVWVLPRSSCSWSRSRWRPRAVAIGDGHRRHRRRRLPGGDAPRCDRPARLVHPAHATAFGVLRSARPNDMVEAGIGRTFQNIRLFANMTALENVLVGMHLKLHANAARTRSQHARARGARSRRPRPGARAAGPGRAGGRGGRAGEEPALRRPAPPRDRPGAGHRARSCCCSTSRPPA